MGFQSGCCDRASKLGGDLRSRMPLSQVLQLGDIVCRPAAEGGIGHVFLKTMSHPDEENRKLRKGSSGPAQKGTCQKWNPSARCPMRPVINLESPKGRPPSVNVRNS